MKSMTGFGNAELTTDADIIIRVEAHSYNKKHLDARVQLPVGLVRFEGSVKRVVSNHLSRGAVFVKFETAATGGALEATFKVNGKLAAAYKKQIEKLKRRLDLSGNVDINSILALPGVIEEETPESLVSEADLAKVAESAMLSLLIFRTAEGAGLKKDIDSRLKILSELLESIAPLADAIPESQKNRLLSNLKSAELELAADDERVLKEVVIFSDRHDASEELTRLKSHLNQFESMLDSDDPVGRPMEFLIQEMQREINTLGTKAAHCDTTHLVVSFKTELEKIREQVQNVE
ncbi:MAG: YicC family protein [Kiritimatiellaeota bacterium]|nr:YicC family protein [Kiritimatiellota bacterium]